MDGECRRMRLPHRHMYRLLFELDTASPGRTCSGHVAARIIAAMMQPRSDGECFYNVYPTLAPDFFAKFVGGTDTLVYNASHDWSMCGAQLRAALRRPHVLHDHISAGAAVLAANKPVHRAAAVHALLLAHAHYNFSPRVAELARGFVARCEPAAQRRDIVLHALHAVCESTSVDSLHFLQEMLGRVGAVWCDKLSNSGRTAVDVLATCVEQGTKTEAAALSRVAECYGAARVTQRQRDKIHASLIKRGPNGNTTLAVFLAAFGREPKTWAEDNPCSAIFGVMLGHVDVTQWGAPQGPCANYHTVLCVVLNNAFLAAESALHGNDRPAQRRLDADVARVLGACDAFGLHTTDFDRTLTLATAAWAYGLWDTGRAIYDGTAQRYVGVGTTPVRIRVAHDFVTCIRSSRAHGHVDCDMAGRLDRWLEGHTGAHPEETGRTRPDSMSDNTINAAADACLWRTAAAVVRHTCTRTLRTSVLNAYANDKASGEFVATCNVLAAVDPSRMKETCAASPYVRHRHIRSLPWVFTRHARRVLLTTMLCFARQAANNDVAWYIASFLKHADLISICHV